ncbi:hypothetical protein CO165_02870 [Candidatus Roizmanbacteria bacterium CG_4_9_14_3_um_filter_33_18]|uniref:Uncharacterized protein n=1 Tax=Candidatus Roizmanbacteria bacterium CG_4_9_14_3_um_filter_33_18 TaxID=1974841 RepID=A0A2M7XY50_9BACT|nr:MAG: hypothetical protein CO165_02870 [Candidatus Roizmanbacteria bacterium CG_4_9_14_3_um_filter_33_18]
MKSVVDLFIKLGGILLMEYFPLLLFAFVLGILLFLKINFVFILLFILIFWDISLFVFGLKGIFYKKTKILGYLTGWFTKEVKEKNAIFWSCIYLVLGILILGIIFLLLATIT